MSEQSMAQAALQTANEAMQMAAVVGAQLEGHENACGRRYEDWRAQSARTELVLSRMTETFDAKINGINKVLWSTSGATILLLIGAVGTLLGYIITGHKSD